MVLEWWGGILNWISTRSDPKITQKANLPRTRRVRAPHGWKVEMRGEAFKQQRISEGKRFLVCLILVGWMKFYSTMTRKEVEGKCLGLSWFWGRKQNLAALLMWKKKKVFHCSSVHCEVKFSRENALTKLPCAFIDPSGWTCSTKIRSVFVLFISTRPVSTSVMSFLFRSNVALCGSRYFEDKRGELFDLKS